MINEKLKHVKTAYLTLREHDCTIPSELLEEFKEILENHYRNQECACLKKSELVSLPLVKVRVHRG